MQLPLLNALKTFIVSAHRLNFTRASEDLLVSPSAISHQIRILEEYLGFKLFLRKNRHLSLTQEGLMLFKHIEGPFNQINKALHNAKVPRGKMRLNVSLRPFISGIWLTRQLSDFWAQHPLIEVNLIHSVGIPDFFHDNINLAIIWGKGDWPNLHTTLIIPGELTPICTPAYLAAHGHPQRPEDLRQHVLIHDENHSAWESWLQQTTGSNRLGQHNLNIDDTNVRLQAAQNGQGVMLGCPTLLKGLIDRGEVVPIFNAHLTEYSYYIAYPKNMVLNEKERLFVDWIQQAATQSTPHFQTSSH